MPQSISLIPYRRLHSTWCYRHMCHTPFYDPTDLFAKQLEKDILRVMNIPLVDIDQWVQGAITKIEKNSVCYNFFSDGNRDIGKNSV